MKYAIIVPGFLASELSAQQTDLFGERRVWVHDRTLFLNGPDILALDELTLDPLPGFPRLFASGRVVQNRFHRLKTTLEGEGWRVGTVAYDWRLSLTVAADLVKSAAAKILAEDPDAERIICIAHSMGGLVARLAYASATQTTRDKWDLTMFLGTPHGGSYEAALSLDALGSFARWYYGEGAESTILRLFSRNDPRRLVQMMRTWPALYQLFPPQVATWFSSLDGDVGLLYDPDNYRTETPPLESHLATADLVHTALEAARATEPNQVHVVGTGIRTLISAHPETEVTGTTTSQVWSTAHDNNGDGVVHAGRAVLPTGRTWTIERADHVDLPANQTFLDNLFLWLQQDEPDEDKEIIPKPPPVAVPPPATTPPQFLIPTFFPPSPVGGLDRIIRHGDP